MRLYALQSAAKSICRLEALARIFGERHKNNLIERLRNSWAQDDRGFRHFLKMSSHHRVIAVRLEGKLARHHFVERYAKRIQVGTIVGGIALHLFWRHVIERAESGAGHGET